MLIPQTWSKKEPDANHSDPQTAYNQSCKYQWPNFNRLQPIMQVSVTQFQSLTTNHASISDPISIAYNQSWKYQWTI